MLNRMQIGVATATAVVTLATGAFAQQPKPKTPAAAPPPAAAAPAGQPAGAKAANNPWVRLCEKAQIGRAGKDGKAVKEERNICLTHHERLDASNGMVLVSAAIRQIEGVDQQHLMIMVPLGMAVQPGLKVAVYTREQWAMMARNEAVDENILRPIDLQFIVCHMAGCTAEVPASSILIEQMKSGGGMMVLAINASAQAIGFPVPLQGFADALAGPAADNVAYQKARTQFMAQLRDRAIEAARQQQAAAGGAPPPTAAPAAPAAPKKQ